MHSALHSASHSQSHSQSHSASHSTSGRRAGALLVLASLLAVVSSSAGCSQLDEPAASDVTLDASVVKSQSSALSAAASSAASNDGVVIADAFANVGNSAAALIPRTKGGSRSQVKAAASALASSTTCRCATASAKTCSFDGCTIGSAVAHGTISWAAGRLECTGLSFDVPALGTVRASGQDVTIGATHINVACGFDYTTSSLSGKLTTTGTTTVEDVDYSWDATLDVKGVTFTKSSFTTGSVDVGADVTTISAARGTNTFTVSGAVTFP